MHCSLAAAWFPSGMTTRAILYYTAPVLNHEHAHSF
jgi:hypothetical protein